MGPVKTNFSFSRSFLSSTISTSESLPIKIFLWLVDLSPSSAIISSSYSFSPGLRPVYLIAISTPGSKPESLIRSFARSTILTGLPISSTKISPPFAIEPASRTSCTASGMVIKNRVILGCVMVTGPPSAICFLNKGITLPLLPKTFPKRTATNWVLLPLFIPWITISASLLEAPMILVGFTALSVEIRTNLLLPYLSAHSATFKVPNTLFFIASIGLCSIKGTCLWAAA